MNPKAQSHERPVMPRWLWQGKLTPAFWTVSSVVSMTVNVILIVVLLVVGKQLFTLKQAVVPLVEGLNQNFVLMDKAVIATQVEVHDHIPVVFDLPVKADTDVVLSQEVLIRNAHVNLSTGGLVIRNAPADIVLPEGTVLPIRLSIVVPVNTKVPVDLNVPVKIPLRETELHRPFVGLQQVVAPYKALLDSVPDSWEGACERYPSLWCDFTWGMMDAVP
jgi:hypothetical protein